MWYSQFGVHVSPKNFLLAKRIVLGKNGKFVYYIERDPKTLQDSLKRVSIKPKKQDDKTEKPNPKIESLYTH